MSRSMIYAAVLLSGVAFGVRNRVRRRKRPEVRRQSFSLLQPHGGGDFRVE